MSLTTERLRLRRKRLFIPVSQFTGLQQVAFTPAGTVSKPTLTVTKGAVGLNLETGLSADAVGATLNNNTIAATLALTAPVSQPTFTGAAVAVDTLIKSAGAGNPILAENGALGLMGLCMNTNGDDVRHFMEIPYDLDRAQPVRVRMVFSTQSLTAADTILWKFFYKALIPGTTVIAAPATAPDTVIVSGTVAGVANTLQKSADGIINANKLLGANRTAQYWAFICEMDTKAVGLAENIHFYGVEFEYSQKLTNFVGRGKEGEAIVVN